MFRGEKENNIFDIITTNNINNYCCTNSVNNYQSGDNNYGNYPTFEKKNINENISEKMKFELDLMKNYSQYLDKMNNLLKKQNEERLKMDKKQSKEKKVLEECQKLEKENLEESQKLEREKLEKENYGIINLHLKYFSKEKDRGMQENEAKIIQLNESQDNQNFEKKKEENKNKKDNTKNEKKVFESQNSKKRNRDGGNDSQN